MKIAFLGGDPPDFFGAEDHHGMFNVTTAIRDSLVLADHEVLGIRASSYLRNPKIADVIVVSLFPPTARPPGRIASVVASMREAKSLGVPVLVYFKDWDVDRVMREMLEASRSVESARKIFFNRASVTTDPKLLHDFVSEMFETTWPPALYNAWEWGDINKIDATRYFARAYTFDPSVLWKGADFSSSSRERRWVMAAFTDVRAWLGKHDFKWPVVRFGGSRNVGSPVILKEDDVTRECALSTGVLSHSYPHAGSGWFRLRFLTALHTECVLFASPDEVSALGNAYLHSLSEIEDMRDSKLQDLSHEQSSAFWSKTMSRDDLVYRLDTVVREMQGSNHATFL